MKKLTIAVDFDHTYAADPDTFAKVVDQFLDAGHEVLLVTKRHDDDGGPVSTEVYETVTNDIPIIFVGQTDIIYKDPHVKENYEMEVDIWIDDKPEFIRSPSQIKEELDQMIFSKYMVEEEVAFFKEYVNHLEDVVKAEAHHIWDEIKSKFSRRHGDDDE